MHARVSLGWEVLLVPTVDLNENQAAIHVPSESMELSHGFLSAIRFEVAVKRRLGRRKRR